MLERDQYILVYDTGTFFSSTNFILVHPVTIDMPVYNFWQLDFVLHLL